MKKRVFSLFLALVVTFSMVCPLVFADDSSTHVHNWTSGVISEFSDTVEGIPVSVSVKKCTECNFYKHTYKFFGLSFDFYSVTAYTGIVDDFLLDVSLHIMNALGKNATAKPYQTGGGSAGTGGVGRRPSGYSGTGVPTCNADGEYQLVVYPSLSFNGSTYHDYPVDLTYNTDSATWKVSGLSLSGRAVGAYSDKVQLYYKYELKGISVPGLYYIKTKQSIITHRLTRDHTTFDVTYVDANSFSCKLESTDPSVLVARNYNTFYIDKVGNANSTVVSYFHPIIFSVIPDTPTIKQQTNITINNNTWNGNIYQDNSTNLTYIYPQYTTINENNETVTNISNNPIIYNNETKQYYTYDSVTNNYYYITYETPSPSPSPSPSPEPSETPTPTPAPGGDTGDTSNLLDVLIDIKDNMIQGFADIKATLVQGWADLSANFTLAIENLNLNITNIFNKKFPDQSTPETATPSPSPSPDPGTNPTPTPKPDGSGDVSTPESGKPGSSSGGQSWWEKLLGKIGAAIVDGLLGAVSAVLKLIFKLFSTILGWIIWLVSQVLTLFPFLPPGLGALLIGGVVVCFIIGLIKFIRG